MRLPKFVAALSMTAVLACGMVAIPQTAAAQEDKATTCAQELNIKGPSTEKTGEVPALLVHGHDGEPDTWTEPEHSMKRALDPTEKLVVVPPFDYHKESTKWVANSDAAHRLAKTIVCYYLLYGEKVVVGAHSMGGLLAYEAFDWAAYGVYAKDAVGHLVTIGSPFKGTILATLGFEGIVALCRLMGITPRGQRPMEELCREANSDKSISGLSYDSDQLKALPHLPKGITHKAIAGRIQMKFCLIKCIPFSVGDGVVPSDSATARYTDTGVGDGKTIFDCTVSEGGWCEHGSMLRAPKVQKEVKKSIEAYLASQHVEMTNLHGLKLPLNNEWELSYQTLNQDEEWPFSTVVKTDLCDQEQEANDYCPNFKVIDTTTYEEQLSSDYPGKVGDCFWYGLQDDSWQTSPQSTEKVTIGGKSATHRTHWECDVNGSSEPSPPSSASEAKDVMHSWEVDGIVIVEYFDSDDPLPGLKKLLAGASWS